MPAHTYALHTLAIVLLLYTGPLPAQTWTQIADYPGTARDDGAAFTVGNTTYFGTGLEVGWQPTLDFYSYSFAEGWSPIASLPEGMERQYACGCAGGDFGYLFGGVGHNSNYFNDLWRYEPGADTWTAMNPLPGPGRSGMACFRMGGTLYFVGGRLADGTYLAETWTYLIENDSWLQLADYPGGAVWRMQAGVQGQPGQQSAFVSTGLRQDGTFHGSVYAYLEATNGWSGSLGSLPGGGRMYASVGSYMGKVVLFAGQAEDGTLLDDLWTWNWNGLLWEALNPLPSFPRRGGMMATLGGELIYTTGLNPDFDRIQDTWTTALGVNVANAEAHSGIMLYPNPGRDVLCFSGAVEGPLLLRFCSLDGKWSHTERSTPDGAISVDHLPKGMYLVEITTAQGWVERRKWVKE